MHRSGFDPTRQKGLEPKRRCIPNSSDCPALTPASSPAGVCVREVTKRYGSLDAVREVSFNVVAGEIFGLLGPNGAGKTTLLECILGLRRPDSGSITIGGIDALAHPEQAKRLLGAQIQCASLQDKITPRQALKLFASFYRKLDMVGYLIERFSLSSKADASFDSLSGGQKQRLFLALAFISDPPLVVLDEPTLGLDPQSRRELHRIIIAMRASGRTVLLTTHYLDEAHNLCDRIGILEQGQLIVMARPDELIARASALPRVALQTALPLSASQVSSLPGVLSCQAVAAGWVLTTRDVNRTIVGLVQHLEDGNNKLLDLQIHRPSLEDVFIELTGKVWSPSQQAGE